MQDFVGNSVHLSHSVSATRRSQNASLRYAVVEELVDEPPVGPRGGLPARLFPIRKSRRPISVGPARGSCSPCSTFEPRDADQLSHNFNLHLPIAACC